MESKLKMTHSPSQGLRRQESNFIHECSYAFSNIVLRYLKKNIGRCCGEIIKILKGQAQDSRLLGRFDYESVRRTILLLVESSNETNNVL